MKKEYRNESGQYHREDGPAIIHNSGSKEWFINGKLHREGGLPAVEWYNGDKSWWINGKLHREDGPAIEFDNGSKYWYLNDIKYTEQEFNQEIIKLKLKRLVQL